MRFVVAIALVAFVLRHGQPNPGFGLPREFPMALGAPSAGRLSVRAWTSRDGGASDAASFERRRFLGPNSRTVDDLWSGAVGEAIGHVWFARNALLQCPPGTWTGVVAFEPGRRDEAPPPPAAGPARRRTDRRVLAPNGEWTPVTKHASGRHRIEVDAYRASQQIFSSDHSARFDEVIRSVGWINVTALRNGERTDIVLRWFARSPDRELLTQRLAFTGALTLPVAIEADWAEPRSGAHASHELYVLALDPSQATTAVPAAPLSSEAAAYAAQARALAGHRDPWTNDPRAPGAPVIGPLRAGFADPAEAFVPWLPPLRLRGGTPH